MGDETPQKHLGKDAELSAAEVVRRAERCIGLAIRKGQAAGRIGKRGDQRSYLVRSKDLIQPRTLFPNDSDEITQTYAMTDGVTDEAA